MSQRGLEPPTFGLGNRCSIQIELPRLLRRVRDLNPRNTHRVCRFSRPMQSTTLPTLQLRAIRPTIALLQSTQLLVAHSQLTIWWLSMLAVSQTIRPAIACVPSLTIASFRGLAHPLDIISPHIVLSCGTQLAFRGLLRCEDSNLE